MSCLQRTSFMLRTFLVLFMLLPNSPLFAQQATSEAQRPPLPSPSQYADRMVNLLSNKMELSDQQLDSIGVIFVRFMDAQLIAMQQRDRETMMRLRDERDKAIHSILRDKNKIQSYTTVMLEQSPMRRGPGNQR
jgi:hypothetical protein